MTAARLRAAADRLENGLEFYGDEVAALLRAVAGWGHDRGYGECYPDCRMCAALALADSILGSGDE